MSNPTDYKYTKDHEWAKREEKRIRVGITEYAQQELGDIVFVELPEVGKEFQQGDTFCTVESVKAVSEIYAPVSGTVVEVNEALTDAPETVNQAPFADGWMVLLEPSDESQLEALLSAADYDKMIEELSK